MFDLPLHPILVHFPIVLGISLPFVSLPLWWVIKKGQVPAKVWVLVAGLALLYTASAVLAAEFGEDDEKKVVKIVAEKVIEDHAEVAEKLPWAAGTLFVISIAGLWIKNTHHVRLAFAVLSLVALIPLGIAGHTGGKLVYQYGASIAHLPIETKALIQSGQFFEKYKNQKMHEEDDD